MYKLLYNNPDYIQRLSDGAFISVSTQNADYRDFLAWVELGNVPEAADPPPPPAPSELARGGAKQWFIDNPATTQLFTLSIADLETEINNLVDALFPAATAQNRTRTKKLWMAYAVSIRFLVKRELNGDLEV